MDNESKMMAGFNPIALPIMRGVRYKSCIHCTIPKTKIAKPKINQKFSPVSAERNKLNRIIGMIPIACI